MLGHELSEPLPKITDWFQGPVLFLGSCFTSTTPPHPRSRTRGLGRDLWKDDGYLR